METVIQLTKEMFQPLEHQLLQAGEFSVKTFQFQSGVSGLKIQNSRGEIILLPYQGQQIWSAIFDGRNLTMRSMFPQPRPTRVYLETYGAFFIHCGFTAMGVPSAGDTHPLHGELPNAPYDSASLVIGENSKGEYIGLRGEYTHTVAFNTNYKAEPEVQLYAGSALLDVSMTFTNLKATSMEYMYLAHVNFRPVDYGKLFYTAIPTPNHVRVRKSIPSHIKPKPGYREFLEELSKDPTIHHELKPGLFFDPEVVFIIDYLADENGWAHSMQLHPDGTADYIRHRPDQLSKGVRWICRTPDQDALGVNLPATAEPEGYTAEKAKGNVRSLGAGEKFHFDLEVGLLRPEEASAMALKIQKLIGKE